jgi:hypothetical protein
MVNGEQHCDHFAALPQRLEALELVVEEERLLLVEVALGLGAVAVEAYDRNERRVERQEGVGLGTGAASRAA